MSTLPTSTAATESAVAATVQAESIDTVLALSYSTAPDHIYPFIYRGNNPYLSVEIDTGNCTENALYVYDDHVKTLSLIVSGPVEIYTATKDGVYYVSGDGEICYSDYSGVAAISIGVAQGDVSSLDYFNGTLSFVENEKDIVFLSVKTGARSIVWTDAHIDSIYQFDQDKLIWRDADDNPFYLNTTTGVNTPLANDFEVNCLLAPYITPSASAAGANARTVTTASEINDITFPLAAYPVPTSGTNRYYTTAVSFFNNTNKNSATCNHSNDVYDCKRYGGHSQCFGFAIYAHDCYLHIEDWNKTSEGWAAGDFVQCTQIVSGVPVTEDGYRLSSTEVTKDFFQSLQPGAYIRYGKDNDSTPSNGVHSVVVASIEDNGVWVYECNQDNKCGVHYWYYEYSYLPQRYQHILNYVNHTFSDAEYENTATHTVPCANCDGYLRQEHSSVAIQFVSPTQHQTVYSCCDHTITAAHSYQSVSYVNIRMHKYQYDCCGSVLRAHSSEPLYAFHNSQQHKVTYTCCGYILENHDFSGGLNSICNDCGYSTNALYSRKEDANISQQVILNE